MLPLNRYVYPPTPLPNVYGIEGSAIAGC
jgi:hypothetical protein